MNKLIKSLLSFMSSLLVLVGVVATPVGAANPHFISASAEFGSGDSLVVKFKEAGLGDNQNIRYVASADAKAEYACINKGGKHPQASNKESVEGPVSAEGTFSSGQNGAISKSLTIRAPSAGDFSCPSGQKLVLVSVFYNNVAITDTTNNVSKSISGTFERVFITFD